MIKTIGAIIFLFSIATAAISYAQPISKKDWVKRCKNAAGEEKLTFKAIRAVVYSEEVPSAAQMSLSFFAPSSGNKFSCGWTYDKLITKTSLQISPNRIYNGNVNLKSISDLKPLSGLTNLTFLNLSGNRIEDLRPLSGLTKLRKIELEDNQISDLNPLAGLKNTEELNLWGNKISDFSMVSHVSNLHTENPGSISNIDSATMIDHINAAIFSNYRLDNCNR